MRWKGRRVRRLERNIEDRMEDRRAQRTGTKKLAQ